LLDAEILRLGLDRLGLGDAERVGFLLRLGEADDRVLEVELLRAVLLQGAGRALALTFLGHLFAAGAIGRSAAGILCLGARGQRERGAQQGRTGEATETGCAGLTEGRHWFTPGRSRRPPPRGGL